MSEIIDYTRDLKELAALAALPNAVEDVLERALESLKNLIPYDLAAVLELVGEELKVRVARGALADKRVRRHRFTLKRFPTVRRALETRQPIALLDDHHSEEGDPYDAVLDLPDGHSCMVVPLFAGERCLGAITFDRRECQPYTDDVLELAGVYAQIVALAMICAEQAALLRRFGANLKEQTRLLVEDAGLHEACAWLQNSRSPVMQRLVRVAQQVARTDTAVLILGETGCGKEVLAQALHSWSPRNNEAFVKLNCSAIPENLVESELFGHTRGAFSGARSARPGRFLTANGGTLFLDEIGDMPLAAQSRLLRVLQEGVFEPVGSDTSVRVDVRVLAATHVDLHQAVRQGAFREDLYYRLAVFPLTIPPLRERREDVVPIAEQALATLTRRTGRGPWSLSGAARAALERRPWPGNVRQLVNSLERATILTPSGRLDTELLAEDRPGLSPTTPDPAADGPLLALDEVQRRHICRVLRHTDGKVYGQDGAAVLLGLKPTTLQSRMKKLKIDRQQLLP